MLTATGVDKAATLGLEFFQILVLVQTVKNGNSCGVRPCLFALPRRLEKGLLQASFGRFPQSIAHSFALEIRHGRTASNFVLVSRVLAPRTEAGFTFLV